ncbi:MAG: lysophospholipid acyltransferase family protein [Bacteroidales bacterium]
MKYLYSVYAWLVGGILFVFILLTGIGLSYILPGHGFHRPVQWMFRWLFRILFIRVSVSGKEHLRPGITSLYMSNHCSMFDLPMLVAYIPEYFRGLEAHNQFSWPLWGLAIRRYGNIPMDRGSTFRSLQAIREARATLDAGTSVVILPEGHLSLDGSLKEFKKLPFMLAAEAGVQIMPMGLSGLFEVKRKGSWLMYPASVTIAFGAPITPDQIGDHAPETLRDITREKIASLLLD